MAVRLAILSYCLVIPGRALVRWLGVQTTSRIDAILIVVILSLSSVSAAVTLLLFANLYFRVVLVVLLLCPAVFLIWSRLRQPRLPPPAAAPAIHRGNAERAVLAVVGIFLCVYFVDALTSPAGGWDGLVTWGKWAADWGGRSGSRDYIVGGSPQLVPRLLSVLYKLDGTSRQVLPLDAFVSHAFAVLATAWFVLACVRLANLLGLPSWPLLLLSFGSLTFREQIGSGAVDVPLAAGTVTLLALFAGVRNGEWRATRGAWTVLGAAMFVCIFTKLTGAFALAALAGMALPGALQDRTRNEARQLLLALTLALVAIAPFAVEQRLAESRARYGRSDPADVNVPTGGMARLAPDDVDPPDRRVPLATGPKTAVRGFWDSYEVPDVLRWPLSALLVALFAAGAVRRNLRGLAVVVSLYALAWLAWSSHDQRNLFLALPLIAAIAATGAAGATARVPNTLRLLLLAVVLGTFVASSGAGLLRDGQAMVTTMVVGSSSLAGRVAMMPQDAAERPPFFFPPYADVYRYISALTHRTGAGHVFASSPLFRFYENGVFTLFDWPEGLSRSGDVFAGHDRHRPDDSESWVLLAAPGWHRVWLREELQDVAIPSPESANKAGLTGSTEVMIETGPFDFDNGLVAWQVTVADAYADSHIAAAFVASDPRSIDTDLSSTTVEKDERQQLVRYSGMVALKAGTIVEPGAVRVGVRVSGPPVQIVAFKLSRRRGDGHRPGMQ